ncbi:glycyl-tRNA synthetase beta subunit, GlyRS [Candidatus Photodesmus katoptron Akat1]|uniref:Glycine--tRNA ligase beta subunit n=1 Tax=Candidatus Photodesmus katoptron Akat1 TaxID=1236703 RepID=S3DK93_9GAMM|nr:glycyl-tRNA synthetase beta subunit, GlyRS [Candidatus Photodesmus katoptron Akat1]
MKEKNIAKTFLIELGTEELPSLKLRSLGESFSKIFEKELKKERITYKRIKWYATPRRLALKVTNLLEIQPTRVINKRGPSISVAFDTNGKATQSALSWAKSNNIQLEEANHLVTKKGKWLVLKKEIEGKNIQELIIPLIKRSIINLSKDKTMRWGNSNIRFIRPIKTLTILLNDELIHGEILGVSSSRTIHGHRFIGKHKLSIQSANQYPKILKEQGKVIADFQERKEKILLYANKAAEKIGGVLDLDDTLLEEITSLVEWPVILIGKFKTQFLKIPLDALVYTMKTHQKCLPVYENKRKKQLLPNFIFVANIESKDPNQIINGNEKVIHSRLSDAKFFFIKDRKRKLIEYLPELDKAIFQKQLGTLKEKTERIVELSTYIAKKNTANIKNTKRAALLSKCDLMTSMVFEFSEMQGIIGMHYASYDGEEKEVAIALYEQYRPRFSGDLLPSRGIASSLALADKLDTIVGIFGINQIPKKGGDPFALRRLSLGVLRIIIENSYDFDLADLITKSKELFKNKLTNNSVEIHVIEFILARLHAWYKDSGFDLHIIQSVLATKSTKLIDVDERIKAISNFIELEKGKSFIAVTKRVTNILVKCNFTLKEEINPILLCKDEEKILSDKIKILKQELNSNFILNKYSKKLEKLAQLTPIINTFFDKVTIISNDKRIRQNRLTILKNISNLFQGIADFSILKE